MSHPTPEDRKLLAEIAGLVRDYRKECWIATYAAAIRAGNDVHTAHAKTRCALDQFDQEFQA